MLHSKYLTQEGMEMMLKNLYQNGWRYISRIGQSDSFYVSVEEPIHDEGGSGFTCRGARHYLEDALNVLIADALKVYKCVKIANHVDIVDWSAVKVDTPVKIFDDNGVFICNRHFADYHNGKVYVFLDGQTSWTAVEEPIPVTNVKLEEK